jgi:hypothetical protein
MEEEPLLTHTDVPTIMDLLADVRDDVRAIRRNLEDDDGEEEEGPEADG